LASKYLSDRVAVATVALFLTKRLASIETINWALQLNPNEPTTRAALLQLIDSAEGHKLAEPWRTAWRMIEEYWDAPPDSKLDNSASHQIRGRVRSGERSGSLVTAILERVAPRLRVSGISQLGQSKRRPLGKPRSVAQLLSGGLTSGSVIDPGEMGLHEVDDDGFLIALASGLEGALAKGLDIARRLGWDGERKLYKLGLLHRVYFVAEADRKSSEHEPDVFHSGIAPCVKLLCFVVERLASRHATAAADYVARWKLTPSPIHLRLWAALSRNRWVAPAEVVGRELEALDDRRYWDIRNFPEIAELRAVRFDEFGPTIQRNLAKRLRKLPSRDHWPRAMDRTDIDRERLIWSLREFRRIQIAGGTLSEKDKLWLTGKIANFPGVAQMSRLDDGFVGTSKARWIAPNPDDQYNLLTGEARLSALETALRSTQRGWRYDTSGRASDWLLQPGNAAKLIADFEVIPGNGGDFPKAWEHFGRAHRPMTETGGPLPQTESAQEAMRVLSLLAKLPTGTIRQSIDGVASWMSTWRSQIAQSEDGAMVWERMWPIAVEATNAGQQDDAHIDLNLLSPSTDGREPLDLDTLNTPVGELVGVFLEACPRIDAGDRPFSDKSAARRMRDTAITATGRSGLIVRHRLIEYMQYFVEVDPEWTEQQLIGPLLRDDDSAISLWRALGRQLQFVRVLQLIGAPMISRVLDSRLGRETRQSLVLSLVVECLHSYNESRRPAVSLPQVQQMIRALDDEDRAHAAGALRRFVYEVSAAHPNEPQAPTAGAVFRGAAAPFLRDVWPQERSLATPGISKAFAGLPATSRDAFAIAVDAIQRFLVPFDCWSMLDYGLYSNEGDEPKLSIIDDAAKGLALLQLLDSTIGTAENAVIPYELGDALAQIEKTSPGLVHDPIFRRLAAVTRR
jgi:hypothetical protein